MQLGHRTLLAAPLLRDGAPIGIARLSATGRRPFTEQQIALLETFADQAVIAIENARLFEELEQRNAELQESNRQVTEALEQQTATAEVLRVISPRRPTSSRCWTRGRECRPAVRRRVGDTSRRDGGASLGRGVRGSRAYSRSPPATRFQPVLRLGRGPAGRARAADRAHCRCPADPSTRCSNIAGRRLPDGCWRCRCSDGRDRSASFMLSTWTSSRSPEQIELVKTFADQAVIAIENARLFQELQRSVEELQALGEISQAVSSTLDLQQVLTSIVVQAVELSGVISFHIRLFRIMPARYLPSAAKLTVNLFSGLSSRSRNRAQKSVAPPPLTY